MDSQSQKYSAQWNHTNSRAVLAIHEQLNARRTRKQRARLTKKDRVNSVMEYARAHHMKDVVKYLQTAQRQDGSFTFANVLSGEADV